MKKSQKTKTQVYIWDYIDKKDDMYDSGGFVIVDYDKNVSYVMEINESTPNTYKCDGVDLENLRLEFVKKKHFRKGDVEGIKDSLEYIEMPEGLKEEINAYLK